MANGRRIRPLVFVKKKTELTVYEKNAILFGILLLIIAILMYVYYDFNIISFLIKAILQLT